MRTEKIYYLVSALNEFALEIPYLAYYIFQTLGLGFAYLYMAIFALVFGLLDYPTGGIADRIGRKRTFAFGIFLVGINFLLLAFFIHPITIVIAALFFGFGSALQSGSLEAWIADEMKRANMFEELDRVFGRAVSLSLIADVTAGILGSIITFLGGYWWTIPFGGLVALVAAVLAIIIMRENVGGEERQPYSELLKKGAKILLGKRALVFLTLSQTLFIAGAYAYWETLTPVYSERGIPEEMFGILGAAMHLPAVFTTAYAHRLGRKIGVKKSAIVLSFGWAVFCSLMIFLVHPNLTILLVIILESTFATRHPIIEFWQNTLIPSDVRATVLSGISTMMHVGQSFVLFFLSPFVEVYGTLFGLSSAAVLSGLSVIALLLISQNKS
ncbi:MAG: MFS transporter [Candidatus Bathyarchaeota archaeon]|nr:MFS transporter [Candidatus Bathyarchaeota archaeon]